MLVGYCIIIFFRHFCTTPKQMYVVLNAVDLNFSAFFKTSLILIGLFLCLCRVYYITFRSSGHTDKYLPGREVPRFWELFVSSEITNSSVGQKNNETLIMAEFLVDCIRNQERKTQFGYLNVFVFSYFTVLQLSYNGTKYLWI